ncbi:Transposase [Rhizobium aethiopicum]|uniref:Transposase n=1 Tax=Rhizobium aethiopicum TaxID=1138170 RepID=A0A1C3YDC9_9HYPH|nr:Transposase [Rhizobium aethiopicum]
MTRPYSNDLRERVVASVAAGQSCRVVADRFDIAVSSVVKWSQRHRATGSVTPGKMAVDVDGCLSRIAPSKGFGCADGQ